MSTREARRLILGSWKLDQDNLLEVNKQEAEVR